MRAVNLIPDDLRRGGVGAPGRSGNGVYVFLGALAAMVVLFAGYVLAGNTVSSKKTELAEVQAKATQAQAQAAALKPYNDFAALSQSRSQTVASLAASRFDWDRAIRQTARVLPTGTQITGLKGTINPQVTVDGGETGDTQSLRAASSDPAIELGGCAGSQTEVAQVMSRLRLVDGVTRVTLAGSDKGDKVGAAAQPASAGGQTSSAAGTCASNRAKFGVVMFFAPLGGPANTPGSGARAQPIPAPPTSKDIPAGGGSGPAGPVQPGATSSVAEATP